MRGATTSIASQAGLGYPEQAPYSPSEQYPEYPFGETSESDNHVYRKVRDVFIDAGLDRANVGRSTWNPLGRYIQRGGRTFVLCNFVFHRRPLETAAEFQAKCVHGSVLRALLDYVYIAAGPAGVIEFGNAPLQSCQWPRVLIEAGAHDLCAFYRSRGVSVSATDLRHFVAEVGTQGLRSPEDEPADPVMFDLASDSHLEDVGRDCGPYGRPRVRDYDPDRTERFHLAGSHIYSINKAVLEADTVVSLPKLKTHEKVGLTCALKGLVGSVAHKDCLAHHRFGAPKRGGDEFPNRFAAVTPLSHWHDWLNRRSPDAPWQRTMIRTQTLVSAALRRLGVTASGAWHGNDTAWRMVHDLYRILHYGDCDGALHAQVQRKHIALVDGIVGGEGDGPLAPRPVSCGALVFSDDLMTADRVAWRLMGYQPAALKLLCSGSATSGDRPMAIVRSNGREMEEADIRPILGRPFMPPRGWRSYLAAWLSP